MYLTRWRQADNRAIRWAVDDYLLQDSFNLSMLLGLEQAKHEALLNALKTDQPAAGELLAPIDTEQEVWASGVTYMRSREARMHESETKDIYDKVYEAQRPELFFKAQGWRVAGSGQPIRVRVDAHWNVPEPELTLVINRLGEIVGFCAGNDVSSRDIEGANPLYLPQAKVYNGSCALGPGIRLASAVTMTQLPVTMTIMRTQQQVYQGQTSTEQIKRPLQELADYLVKELVFPHGVFLMTGAGIVPDDEFTLQMGDQVTITVADLRLINEVEG